MNTPPLLKSTSSSFFRSAKEKRKLFRKLINIINVNLSTLQYENYVIVGSRSWNMWYKQLKNKSTTSNVSYLKGNWDIFIFTDDIENTLTNMLNMFNTCKNSIQELLIETGNVSLEATGFTKKKIGQPINTLIYPGYELLIYITKYSKIGGGKEKFDNNNSELLMYCKVFPNYINLSPIITIHNEYKYLNTKGLYLFIKLMKTIQRKNKGINIDAKREEELIKHVGDNHMFYIEVVNMYIRMFSKIDNYYDDNIITSIYMDFLKSKNPLFIPYIDEFEKWSVERFRKYINTMLAYMDDLLTGDDEEAYIFLVGGDAMRRHKRTITRTADFDCKLYCKKSWYDKMDRLVKTVCSKTVVYLNSNIEDGYPSKIVTDLFTVVRGSFRLRKIEPHETFNVNLYSIDFRVILYTEKTHVKIDIPILDIVIETFTKLPKKTDTVVYKGNKLASIPVGSIPFLLKDIANTYSDKDKARMRFWNKKNKKDIDRFRQLKELLSQYDLENNELNYVDDNLYEYLRYNYKKDTNKKFLKYLKKQYNININDDLLAYEAYMTELNEMMKAKRRERFRKFKMSFLSHIDT